MTPSIRINIAIVLSLTAILFSACQQAELPKAPETMDTTDIVYATIEDATDTRTSLDGERVLWSSGDEIVVFKGKTLRSKYVVDENTVGTTEGVFNKDASYESLGASSNISSNVAFYPFAEITCKAKGQTYTLANITLPSVQTYAPASFGQGVFPMVAVTADTDDVGFAFKNVCGVLALQLKGSGAVKSISVKGNSDEILCGEAVVTAAYGKNPEIALLSSGGKTVTLECGESGVELQNDTPTSFLIALPTVSFDNGFTVTVADVSGTTKEYSTTKKNVILRSGILRMPEKEFVGERVPQESDYIDEYGINHGQGVKIGETVWAPVNCGYHATDFKYGKLYQWGRKYGQGYDGELRDGGWNHIGDYSDSSVPEEMPGPVSLSIGQSKDNENKFYYNSPSPDDWCISQNDKLWNSGSEENPLKTEYDPCPDGWRVPTYSELDELNNNYSSWTSVNRQNGRWFSGSAPYSSSVPQVFLPAVGYRNSETFNAYSRGGFGCYWSSMPSYSDAYSLIFRSNALMYNGYPRAFGLSVRCVQDASELIPVETISLSKTSLTLAEGSSEVLSATIIPSNATYQTPFWWSDNPSVATVDSNGNVTAISEGTTIITAMAGMQVATCEVTVKAAASDQVGDYIDEYGINHGQGVEIDGVVWAPVNCGYHETDFKYGKLYQWGRKYGQGYDGGLFDGDWNYMGDYSDSSVPEIVEGPVSLSVGQSKDNENKFYYNSSYSYDWCSPQDDKLWNSGTEENPKKTEYDPCPEGWRVPTYSELDELNNNYSSLTSENDQKGRWFSGSESYSPSAPQVFFPAAGYRDDTDVNAHDRGRGGLYWSSRPGSTGAYRLRFSSCDVYLSYYGRANGYSVRCVQATDEVAEL